MWGPIPDEVIRADRVHHAVLQAVHFSRHLNPTNAPQARRAFLAGAEAPPFSYRPLVQADRILEQLDKARSTKAHPAGELVARCVEGTRLMTVALRDRTCEAFAELAEHAGWLPSPELLALRFEPSKAPPGAFELRAADMVDTLRSALSERGLDDWEVLTDPVMASRVLVDGAKRIVKVSPRARFRDRDLKRLVVHEIDVHATRAVNGQLQALRCFQTGLPGALKTEEGLAMVAEEQAGVSSPGALARQAHVVQGVHDAQHQGFRQLYEGLSERVGRALAWGICVRVKRGLADPGGPGVYAKDTVYLAGRMSVRAWLDAGGDIAHLYVGKVGIEDPVSDWITAGWVRPGPVPALWRSPKQSSQSI